MKIRSKGVGLASAVVGMGIAMLVVVGITKSGIMSSKISKRR